MSSVGTPVPPAARFRGGSLFGVVVTLIALVLPALVCGSQIDAPVYADEIARLRTATLDPTGAGYGPASLFYGMFLPAVLGDDLGAHVSRARLATVVGMLGISCLLYLAVVFARSRGTAALACIAFAAAPSTSVAVLRPEVPVTLFGMLGVVILVGMPIQLAQRRRRSGFGNVLVVTGLALAVGVAFALALASNTRYGILLLIPGGCALLSIVLAGVRFGALLRRRRDVLLEPFWGFTRRVAPWCVTAFTALGVAAWLLSEVGVSAEAATRTDAELFPTAWLRAIPLGFCGVLGGLMWLIALGLRLGRARRVPPDAVLFVACAVLVMQRAQFDATGADALPASPAFAVLVAVGLRLMIVWTMGRVLLRAARAGG